MTTSVAYIGKRLTRTEPATLSSWRAALDAVKRDPVARWNLPDQLFFAAGACHILAGTYLRWFASDGVWAEWIRPHNRSRGSHVYVTDGRREFDYRGWADRAALLASHRSDRLAADPAWGADLVRVDFDLLDTAQLNARDMRGRDQYLHDPLPRAIAFIGRRARHGSGAFLATTIISISSRSRGRRPQLPAVPPQMSTTVNPAIRQSSTNSVGTNERS